MNTRISTKSIISGYGRNLNKTISNLNASRTRVLTKRNFNSIAENPASATRSYKLWRSYNETADYLENTKSTEELIDSVSSSALQVSKLYSGTISEDVLRSINGTMDIDARKTYATTLRGMQEAIVLNMNSTYGDRFLYNGADTKNPPFELSEDGLTLTYRGKDVNDPAVQDELKALTEETLFIDIGLGMKEMTGTSSVQKDSAFNTAISGLDMLGYGNTDTGVSKNAVTLLGQMAQELEKEELDDDRFGELLTQFKTSKSQIADFVADLGTKSEFLENNQKRLEKNADSLNEQILAVDYVDMPEAISDYIWQQYAYNAALKVGTSILSQSFIDFIS